MKVICSYCRNDMGEKEPLDSDLVSHGICPACHEKVILEMDSETLGEYLDRFDSPIVVINADSRVVTVNRMMAKTLGIERKESVGLLGGEVLQCRYAQLPEGCGETVHCQACTVRRAVMDTMKMGEPKARVPAYLNQFNKRVNYLISTVKEGDRVVVTIESVEGESPLPPFNREEEIRKALLIANGE